MPPPTPGSRIALGASLAIAIVLMVVVAMSRPSSSEQNSQLLTADNTVEHSSAEHNTVNHKQTAAAVPPPGSDPEPPVPLPTAAPNTAADSARSNEHDTTLDGVLGGTSGSEPETALESERAAMLPDEPDQRAATGPSDGSSPHAPAADSDGAGDGDSESQETQPPQSGGVPARSQETDDRADPLKRLSRQFARRAAAKKNREAIKATPVAPPANEIFEPTVSMSDGHRKSCLVFVGDTLPAGTLQNNAGSDQSILDSLGERLTAVVFWNVHNPYAVDQFKQLQHELAPFKQLGVQTIAVYVGPTPENYAELCEQFGAGILCLTDADQSYFNKLAKGSVPRTYLLAATGKVIWLDIEYSRTTRYDLRNALHYSLQENGAKQ